MSTYLDRVPSQKRRKRT